jgi:hypothetical protein
MDLTLHWQKIRRNHADAHAALQRAAAAIYERAEEPVPIPQVNEVDLSPALKLGFLTSDSGKIAFSDLEVRYDYLVRHAVDLALSAWNDLETFVSTLDEIESRSTRINVRRKIGICILLLLTYEHGKDLVGRIAEAAMRRNAGGRNWLFWSLYHPFCEALPDLNFEPELLVDALECVLRAVAGDLCRGKIYQAVEKLATRSQDTADTLYKVFVSRLESPVAWLAVNALLGLAKFDLIEAHFRALVLTDSEQPTLRLIGIAALGSFKYAGGDQRDLLCSTLKRLEAFRTAPNTETDYMLPRAYGNLLAQAEEAMDALVELAARPNPAVQNQVADVLFHKVDEAYNQPWYKKALLNLARGPSHHIEMLQYLDYCTERYAKNDPDTALQIVEVVAVGWDYDKHGENTKLPEMLSSTFIELYNNHRNALMAGITRWFASDKRRLHLAARDLHISKTAEIDHIKLFSQFKLAANANRIENLQTLCIPCHKKKTYG